MSKECLLNSLRLRIVKDCPKAGKRSSYDFAGYNELSQISQ